MLMRDSVHLVPISDKINALKMHAEMVSERKLQSEWQTTLESLRPHFTGFCFCLGMLILISAGLILVWGLFCVYICPLLLISKNRHLLLRLNFVDLLVSIRCFSVGGRLEVSGIASSTNIQ